MKANNAIDFSLMALGVAAGLDNIETILGIVLLIVQFLWFTIKLAILIGRAIKSGDLEKGDEALADFIDSADNLINKEDKK